MNLIFLDFDGVMLSYGHVFVGEIDNGEKYIERHKKRIELNDDWGDPFDENCIKGLQLIIDSVPNTKIVVSSSWRTDVDDMQNMWKSRNLPGEIIGVTPRYNHYPEIKEKIENLNKKFNKHYNRGCEIEYFLNYFQKKYEEKINRYVILDDDSDMLTEQFPYFIQTDCALGITNNIAYRAIQILNGNDRIIFNNN